MANPSTIFILQKSHRFLDMTEDIATMIHSICNIVQIISRKLCQQLFKHSGPGAFKTGARTETQQHQSPDNCSASLLFILEVMFPPREDLIGIGFLQAKKRKLIEWNSIPDALGTAVSYLVQVTCYLCSALWPRWKGQSLWQDM